MNCGYTKICVSCGAPCGAPLSAKPPQCLKCRRKEYYAGKLKNPVAISQSDGDSHRTAYDQKVIAESVILYAYRYASGLDLWTGKPLKSEDLKYVDYEGESPTRGMGAVSYGEEDARI